MPDSRRSSRSTSVGVIGGGLVGLAGAYKLLIARPGLRLVVFEKERDVGLHQSTHNSGVLHAGLHYKPGSLKARLAVAGIREMVEFCVEEGIAHEQCGKLVVATNPIERDRLTELHRRGEVNGLSGLRWLGSEALREIEPHAAGIAALHVPQEGIVDYAGVCAALRRRIGALGGEVRVDAPVSSLTRVGHGWCVRANDLEDSFDSIVNCAGLYADRVARMAGERVDVEVLPFRGEYWLLRPEARRLVHHLIYPVPDPTFPFLGVHLTRTVHGEIEAGPNAVLALAREGYRWRQVNLRDLATALGYPGLRRFIVRHPRVATYEVARSLSRRLFARALQKLVPELQARDLVRGPSGVRAQVVDRSGALVQDFELIDGPNALHVLSAPSPAATASLAIGGEVAARLLRMPREEG